MSVAKPGTGLLFLVGLFSAACRAQVIPAPPPGPVLDIFQNDAGQLIATVNGPIRPCGITSASGDPTFNVQGNVITVTQNVVAVTCSTPDPPDYYYQATVNFGRLFNGTYTIDWNFPQLTGTYTVTGNPGIGPEFSGNWFNPAQSGHGFEIEVLATNPPQLAIYWFVFAPHGGQAWIVGTGPISGRRAVIQGFQVSGTGALFPPNFNQTATQSVPWGSLTFDFTDCNNGQVSWNSTVPDFGAGTLAITRLTMPSGLSCP